MIAHAINEATVFFFPLRDLQDLGLTPETICAEDAAQLLRSSALWPSAAVFDFWEACLFCSADGVLLCLRPFQDTQQMSAFSAHFSS